MIWPKKNPAPLLRLQKPDMIAMKVTTIVDSLMIEAMTQIRLQLLNKIIILPKVKERMINPTLYHIICRLKGIDLTTASFPLDIKARS